MSIPNEQFRNGMHVHQRELFGAFDYRCQHRKLRTPQFFNCEWHRGARKTTALINLLIKEACRVPQTKHVYIAPTQVQAREIVWDDPMMIRVTLPDKREMGYKTDEDKMLVTFENGSMLKLGGANKPDAWRGLNAIGFGFDEWPLIKYTTWSEIVRPLLVRELHPNLDMFDVFRWAMFIYTPKGINHATDMFDNACCIGENGKLPECGAAEKMRPNTFASRLDGELSGILNMAELQRMRDEVQQGLIPQAFYDQEIKCSRVTSEEMTLITSEMIQLLNQYHKTTTKSFYDTRKIVSIDPAWGGDVCKIMGLVNCEVVDETDILDKQRNDQICQAAKVMASNIGTKNFIVDTVNGPGVFDGLAGDVANYNVQDFKSSHKATEKTGTRQSITYANKRADAYGYTATQIRNFNVGPIKSRELMRQLSIASRYKTQPTSGRLIIAPKAEIKKGTSKLPGLGCSPDDADAYVMGVWGTQYVQPETEGDVTVDFGAQYLVPDMIGAR